MIKHSLITLVFLFSVVVAVAQPNEVTLVVSGEGSTKEEATKPLFSPPLLVVLAELILVFKRTRRIGSAW